jgi:UDP-N-acetylglucosamine--dolichyl-phosphate N-acetylglucosaminephosphotransferase
VVLRVVLPHLRRVGIVGKDVHKPGSPAVPEMGGLFTVAGFTVGIVMVIAFNTFLSRYLSIDLSQILAVLCVVLMIAIIGTIDDLISVRQSVKALIPIIASLPLVAVRAGDTTMSMPFVGHVDFGIFYSIILVPLGVTGAANAVNMLAGFNGVEAGMGLVAMASLAVVAYITGETAAFLILIIAIGALLATLYFNWYPARVFIGDAGTLSIGAIIVSAVIIGNFELAGVIIIIPYFLDFVIKVANRLPSKGWWGIYRDGKLHCPESGAVGLGQWLMRLTGGISERNLTLALMGIEAVFGIIAIWLFW